MTRSEIRENVFRLIFCAEFHSGEELSAQVDCYFEEAALPDEEVWLPEISEEEKVLISSRFYHVHDLIPELDQKINETAAGWKTDRIGKAELAILRLAVYEMLYDEEVPVKVAINEAVELAKKYGGGDTSAFVNGILAKLA